MINLDLLCMETAQSIASGSGDREGIATKALGVLMENGPYGMLLFLETRKKEQAANDYRTQLVEMFRKIGASAGLPALAGGSTATEWLRTVAQNLDHYLFVKRIWQQTLTYARYHAKAAA